MKTFKIQGTIGKGFIFEVEATNEDEAFKALEDAVADGNQEDQIVYFDDYDMVCNYDINESEV
jgi:DNA/RNA-binding domain of Phe-tRNA-synthetase-like protein